VDNFSPADSFNLVDSEPRATYILKMSGSKVKDSVRSPHSIPFQYYIFMTFIFFARSSILDEHGYRDAVLASAAQPRSGVAEAVWLPKRPLSSRSTRVAAATV
jgi:hypothetical protein